MDLEQLAESINLLVTDKEMQQRFVQSARTRVQEKFSFASRMRHVEQIYRDLIAGRSPQGQTHD